MDGKIEKKLIFVPLIFGEIKFRKNQEKAKKYESVEIVEVSFFSFSPLYFSFFLSSFFIDYLDETTKIMENLCGKQKSLNTGLKSNSEQTKLARFFLLPLY